MTKLEELLKNEKVQWKKLGEIAAITGAGVDKKILDNEKRVVLLNYMDVYKNPYLNKNIPKMIVTAPSSKIEKCNVEYGDIFITPSSETTEDIFKSSVVIEDMNDVVYSYHIMRIRLFNKNFITSCFLNYYFSSEEFRFLMFKSVNGNTRKTISKSDIEKLQVPIPSLEVQNKIVNILDKFTNNVTQLQVELQAELQARNKQYDYYKNKLLSEDYLKSIEREIKKKSDSEQLLRDTTLGEIGTFVRGNGLQKKDFREEGKPVIHYGQIYTKYGFSTEKTLSFTDEEIYSRLRKANQNDILIATTSENIEDVGKCVVWLGEEEIGFSGDMYCYRTKENAKYVAYYFQTAEFQLQKERKVTGTKLIRIHGEDMAKFQIKLPPLEIQEKIVEVLDKFQALIEDAKGLLPQEIEQRQKQYEYYREKLLNFSYEK